MEQFKSLIAKAATGTPLTRDEAALAFDQIMSGDATPSQIGGFLMALRVRGETVDEITGAVATMRAKMVPVTAPADAVDVVGTGGDGVGTINISTGAGLTAASMGLTVAKHGNRAVSSKTGAADAIAALGLPLDLTPEQAASALEEHGFTFLFAQAYHPAMRFVAPVRGALRTPTIFNILGPIINPARLTYQVMGVADASKLDMIAETQARLGRERALVVNGLGLDEITVHGSTTVREVGPEGVRAYEVTPADLGVRTRDLEEILGGPPEENARILREVFEGRGTDGQREVIAVNAGALLYLAGLVESLREGTEAALEQLRSGTVAEHLETMTKDAAAAREAASGKDA